MPHCCLHGICKKNKMYVFHVTAANFCLIADFLFQMLSMRNGLYVPPVNLSGAPEHLPIPQMSAALDQNSAKASDPSVVLQPVNQTSGALLPFELASQHKPLFLPGVPNATALEPRFLVESSRSNLQSLRFTEPAEVILFVL